MTSASPADVVGMHPGTAVHWARLAQRDWSDYLADRTGEKPNADRQNRCDDQPGRDLTFH